MVTVGGGKAQQINDGFAFGRIDELADAQERVAARNGEKIRDAWVGGGGVHLFIGVAEFDLVIALENREQRVASERRIQELRNCGGAEVARSDRSGLAPPTAQPSTLHPLSHPAPRTRRRR